VLGATLLLTVTVGGCDALGAGMAKVRYVEYDHVANFVGFAFQQPLPVPTAPSHSQSVYGVVGVANGNPSYLGGDRYYYSRGVWLVFVICKIDNTSPQAQPFTYDVTKFFVEYNGKRYRPNYLEPFTYGIDDYNWSGGSWWRPDDPPDASAVQSQLRLETQTGRDQETIPASQQTYPNFRFAIYVVDRSAAFSTIAYPDFDLDLRLLYEEGQSAITVGRNQPPQTLGVRFLDPIDVDLKSSGSAQGSTSGAWARHSDLPTTCRP